MMWRVICILIFIMNVVDGLFTVRALSTGKFVEINPFMNYVMKVGGFTLFLGVFKVGYPLLCMFIGFYGLRVGAPYIKTALAFVFSVYFCLTLWHIYLYIV